jgi:GMP synthase PP-ATPase subunit
LLLPHGVCSKKFKQPDLLPDQLLRRLQIRATAMRLICGNAHQTSDDMTADWAVLSRALLKKISPCIINEVGGINRVTYDVSSKPPATIEWE